MHLAAAVALAVRNLGDTTCSTDDLVTALVEAGVPQAWATRLVIFVPTAFARAALGGPDGPRFAGTYTLVDDDGRTLGERPFAEEALYIEALHAAGLDWGRELRAAIACRSAELSAIDQALHAGSQLPDLVCAPPQVAASWLGPEPTEPPVSFAQVLLVHESEALTRQLGELLAAHGLAGEEDGEWIDVPDQLRVLAAVYSSRTGAGLYTLQLDVLVQAPALGERTLVESCAGSGETVEASIAVGLDKFCRGALHPLLAALIDPQLGRAQVEWETWDGADQRWQACMGELLHQDTVPEVVDYGPLLAGLRALWLSEPREPALHWLRVWFMMAPDARLGAEVLVDGQTWPEGQALLEAQPWPTNGEYWAIRHFLLLSPMT